MAAAWPPHRDAHRNPDDNSSLRPHAATDRTLHADPFLRPRTYRRDTDRPAQHLDTGPCTIYLKLESQNPGGSIKDRIGLSMIEAAERRGDIKPGDTLVEGTAGNTGIGLALVAQQKGYKLILVVPDKMSREKIFNLKAMGAQVVLTRSDVAKGHPEYYQDLAERIAARNARCLLHQPVRQSRQPGRARIRHRPGNPARRWTATSTRSCSVAAAPAR